MIKYFLLECWKVSYPLGIEVYSVENGGTETISKVSDCTASITNSKHMWNSGKQLTFWRYVFTQQMMKDETNLHFIVVEHQIYEDNLPAAYTVHKVYVLSEEKK